MLFMIKRRHVKPWAIVSSLLLPSYLTAFQVRVKTPYHSKSGMQREVSLNPPIQAFKRKILKPFQMSPDDRNDFSEESTTRRQLLFSLLAASGSTTMFSRLAAAQEEGSTLIASSSSAVEDDPWLHVIDIMKPPLDDRDYEAYMLDNGLRVLLCSDPSSLEAGAAMDVHVGACSDPTSVPGLAHFNEHMLFLGTKEYPKEDSFSAFLASNGGQSNAYTDSENTVYHFTQTAESDLKLTDGLNRFGSFFTSPLFTESATGRELNAIESEHSKNLQTDSFRVFQIQKLRQNPDHPHSKFFTGNKETLLENTKKAGLDLREELIKFYDAYYSANQMTLAVVAPQSIDTLKEMVNTAFGRVPNKNVDKPENAWKGIISPYDSDRSPVPSFKNAVKVVPVRDLRQVTLSWPIVYEDYQDGLKALLSKQNTYVAHLLGHEGPGSLLSYLKRQGWANGLSSGSESELSDFEVFDVTVALTSAGLVAVDQVVEAVFSYLRMIRERTIPKRILAEVLQLEELQWRYLPKGSVSGYVQSLAAAMQKYPPSLAVAGPRRLALAENDSTLETSSSPRTSFTSQAQFEYTKKLTVDLVDQLTVDNSMLLIYSKTFEGQTDQVERWYGTQYRVDPIPESTLMKWRNGASPRALGIDFPRPNVFIPSESSLRVKYPVPPVDRFRKRTFEDKMRPITPPRIIRDDGPDGRWTVYYKPDDRFGQPKAYVIFELLTKEVFSSPKNAALAGLYDTCVSDKLDEYAYDAGLAGLSYDFTILPRGVRLTFGGYNDKLQTFAAYVAKKVSADLRDTLPNDEIEFERYKDQNMRGLAAFDVKQPYAHCSSYAMLTMKPPKFDYSNRELRDATSEATREDLVSYVDKLWSSGKGVALIQGNLNENEAQKLVNTVDKTLGFKSISTEEYPPQLEPLPMPASSAKSVPTRLVISDPNPANSNSASYVTIQNLSNAPKEHVMLELLSSIMAEPFYEDLRTKQQLGYIVSSGIRPVGKTKSMSFIVQSSVATNEKLTKEILNYLDKARSKLLEKLPEADLAVYVKSLIDQKTEPDKELSREVTRHWAEIVSGRYEFDRIQREAAALLDVTKEDLIAFWDTIYVNDGRRVLITELIPQTGAASSAAPPKSTGLASTNILSGDGLVLGIDDIEPFRNR